jgi:hypothetical protein
MLFLLSMAILLSGIVQTTQFFMFLMISMVNQSSFFPLTKARMVSIS